MRRKTMETTISKLDQTAAGLQDWAGRMRPQDGTKGRFRWAMQTTRDANIGSTAYVLGGIKRAGLIKTFLSGADRAAALDWLAGMEHENGQFVDPALWDRPSPDWPADQPWPSAPMKATINQYAQGIRGICRDEEVDDLGTSLPPPGWPQMQDDPAAIVEWIRRRPFADNAWAAGSHATRMICFLLNWHAQGRFPLEPIAEAARYLFEIQDPRTGLWGSEDQPRAVRINGAFKLFVSLVDQLALPVPNAQALMDQVLAELTHADYPLHAGGCDEFDNWYVLSLLHAQNPAYRTEAIRAEAVRSIHRIIDDHTCPDRGFSYGPHGRCGTRWNGVDMCAASVNQGDALAMTVLAMAINLCVDILGLHDATPWTGVARMRQGFTPEPVKAQLRRLLGDPGEYAGRRFMEACNKGEGR